MRYRFYLLLTLSIFTNMFTNSFAKTISVYDSQTFQKALEDEDYDTIILQPGEYRGNFILSRSNVVIKKDGNSFGEVKLIQENPDKHLFSVEPTGLDVLKFRRLSDIFVQGITFECNLESKKYCIYIKNVKVFKFYQNSIFANKGCLIRGSEVDIEENSFAVNSKAIRFIEGKMHRILDTILVGNTFSDRNKENTSQECFISFSGGKFLFKSEVKFINNQFKATPFRNAICLYDYDNYKFYFEGNKVENVGYFVVIPAKDKKSISLRFSSNILPEHTTSLQIFNFYENRLRSEDYRNIKVDFENINTNNNDERLFLFYNGNQENAQTFDEEVSYYINNIEELKKKLSNIGIKINTYGSYVDYLASVSSYKNKISEILTYKGINEDNIDNLLSLISNLAFIPMYDEDAPLNPSLGNFLKYLYFETYHKLYNSTSFLSFYAPIYEDLFDNFYVNGKRYIDYIPPAPKVSGAACHLFGGNINAYYEWIKNYKYALNILKQLLEKKDLVENKILLRKVVKIRNLLENSQRDLSSAYKIFLFDRPLGIILLNYRADFVRLEKNTRDEIYKSHAFTNLADSFAPFGWIKNKLIVSSSIADYFQDLADEFKRVICYANGNDLCSEDCKEEECEKRKNIWKKFENNRSTKPPCWIEGIEEFVK